MSCGPGHPTKHLLVRRNKHRIGWDVGWRVWDREGQSHDAWWGNTRDRASFESLIADAQQRGYVFELSPEAKMFLNGGRE